MSTYPDVQLYIDGTWQNAVNGRTIPVIDPATEEQIGTVAHAEKVDLDRALDAVAKGFTIWSATSPFERSKLMRRAADLLRERRDEIAVLMTLEQGKPLDQSKAELGAAADVIDWFAEEGRRTYGQIIPARFEGVTQMAIKGPVGPVAAFTPWNFPVNQIVRKLSAALCTGCSIIVKAPEETPASPAALIKVFADAGIPAGVVNLVYGIPAEISEYLIPHPVIRKISFTGSTPIGKQLAALAGLHMKRATMELGGHAPVLIFDDCDLEATLDRVVAQKFRNAGQVCVSPTRFYVQQGIYDAFVAGFAERTKKVRVGSGLDHDTQMGPLANARRAPALEAMIADATAKGARVIAGGEATGNGYFFQPTAIADVPIEADAMNNEPFGPMALIRPFGSEDEALQQANRLPYGLAAFAFTENGRRINRIVDTIESGMVGVNSFVVSALDAPFGGIKESGFGSESGPEGLDGYLVTKAVHIH